jgi:pSer/pThr/pTyr-binding forkhead associated (FHA) protein
MPFRLVSFSGDQSFELPPGRTLVVGRGISSDIAIYDPTISRRHAELTVGTDGVQVKDLGSSNGTCINGSRISAGRLNPNDSITFGKVLFQLKEQRSSGQVSGGAAAVFPSPVVGDTIVRQLMVSGGGPPGITSRNRTSGFGQLRVAAGSAEERQAKNVYVLLDISQKLSSEFDLDKLLGNVVYMMF